MSFLFFLLSSWFTGHPAVDRHNRQRKESERNGKKSANENGKQTQRMSSLAGLDWFVCPFFCSLFLYYTIDVLVRVSPVTFLVSRVPCTKSRDSPISCKVSYKKKTFFFHSWNSSLSLSLNACFLCVERERESPRDTRDRVQAMLFFVFFFCFLLKWQLTDGWK